ncbi:MAG: hypothetical protein HQ564_09885 [Candidatus Saganbacteria bacterium]|nr:hypothetical protein [Candidatus Saganbacteria bacterium]
MKLRAFFNIYQYMFPLVFLPFGYYLWFYQLGGNHLAVWLALSIPIISGYVIPAIGTNYLGLWEFNTRFKLGRFRPHHGFVFGTAAALLGLLCVGNYSLSILELLKAGFISASVFGFWNWLYDTYAIKSGFMNVYNIKYKNGENAEAIATSYAPVYFGMFGFCYGIEIKVLQYYLPYISEAKVFWLLFITFNLIALTIPTLFYMLLSYCRYRDWGLRSFK